MKLVPRKKCLNMFKVRLPKALNVSIMSKILATFVTKASGLIDIKLMSSSTTK